MQACHIHGIPLEGPFAPDGFPFRILDHGSGVNAIGLLPDHQSVFPQQALHHLYGNLPQGADGGNAHGAQQMEGTVSDHGDLPNGKRGEEALLLTTGDLNLPIGFGLTGGNL